jgi:hypothetical protein
VAPGENGGTILPPAKITRASRAEAVGAATYTCLEDKNPVTFSDGPTVRSAESQLPQRLTCVRQFWRMYGARDFT